MLTYGFYNSYEHDRVYDAEQFAMMFDGLINNGVYARIGQKFEVVARDVPNSVIVKSGRAYFNHTWTYNDSDLVINLEPPEVYLNRWDAVVIDIQNGNDVRENKIIAVKGTAYPYQYSSDLLPKPVMINDTGHHQIPIAFIWRYFNENPESDVISQSDISYVVGTNDCPYITGILESFPVTEHYARWAQDWEEFKDQYESDYNAWVVRAEERYNEDTTRLEEAWQSWVTNQETSFTAWKDNEISNFDTWKAGQRAAFVAWMNSQESDFNDWFANLQYVLDGDVAGHLQNEIDDINRVTLNPLPTSKGGTGNKNGYIQTGTNGTESDLSNTIRSTIEGSSNAINLTHPYGGDYNYFPCHMEGNHNTMSGQASCSHIEGYHNRYVNAENSAVHMEGSSNNLSGNSGSAHIEGAANTVKSMYSGHIEGFYNNTQGGSYSHVEGYGNSLKYSRYCHVEGFNNDVAGNTGVDYGDTIHIEGGGRLEHDRGGLTVDGVSNMGYVGNFDCTPDTEWHSVKIIHLNTEYDTYEPYHKIIVTNTDTNEELTYWYNPYRYMENDNYRSEDMGDSRCLLYFTADDGARPIYVNYLTGSNIHIKVISYPIFESNSAVGKSSHAEGERVYVTGEAAHAEGYGTNSKGRGSHSEGSITSAIGHASHAEGVHCMAYGNGSHTEGEFSIARGYASHAGGFNGKAERDYQFVHGPVGFAGKIVECTGENGWDIFNDAQCGIAVKLAAHNQSTNNWGCCYITLTGDDVKFYKLYIVNTNGSSAEYMISHKGGASLPTITEIAKNGNDLPIVTAYNNAQNASQLALNNINKSYIATAHLIRYI